jgi:ubiquitin
MQIFVLMSATLIITLEVEPTDRIEDVKTKVQDKQGIPPDDQRLFFNGTPLADGKTLVDYGIGKDSVLTFQLKVPWSSLFTPSRRLSDSHVIRLSDDLPASASAVDSHVISPSDHVLPSADLVDSDAIHLSKDLLASGRFESSQPFPPGVSGSPAWYETGWVLPVLGTGGVLVVVGSVVGVVLCRQVFKKKGNAGNDLSDDILDD